MVDLSKTLAAIPAGTTRRAYGTAYWDGTKWWANMDGNLIDARWLDPIQPLQGGKIIVDISQDAYGGSTALVIGGYTDQPRPSAATVQEIIPAGVATQIVILGEDGKQYTTDRFSGSYSPGDPVNLMWAAGKPTITGAIQSAAPPAPPPVAPPPPSTLPGEETLIASASDTWWGPGGWGSYATSRNGGEDVYSGAWGGNTVTGAWFYGFPRPVLQGKNITRIRFRLPYRRPEAGVSGDITVHLYAHTSGSPPGSDVNRVTGPHDVPVPQGWQGGDIDLPLSFAAAIVAGGGISIAGNPYVGFHSRLKDPNSGRLILNWSS